MNLQKIEQEIINFIEKYKNHPDLKLVMEIGNAINKISGKTLLVGGFVRDIILHIIGYRPIDMKNVDIDIEIYNVNVNDLISLLGKLGNPQIIGRNFEIIQMNNIDISLPKLHSKRENKKITQETNSIITAMRRRDFTMNAIGFDLINNRLVDFFNGINDIKNKTIRVVDFSTFIDDPLRVLRCMRFVGTFEFVVEKESLKFCQNIDLNYITKDRIGKEWTKMLLYSTKPSLGMEIARKLKIIEKLHPELNALIGVPQNAEFHPEGDVWTHTKLVVDSARKIIEEEKLENNDAIILMYAALCHDFGKPYTTKTINGKIISHGHDIAGVIPTRNFLLSLAINKKNVTIIEKLVKEHMFLVSIRDTLTDSAVRRLAKRLHPATIQQLLLLIRADKMGMGKEFQQLDFKEIMLEEKSKHLSVSKGIPKQLVLGRHLIKEGVKPGKRMGKILKDLFSAQLDGKFNTVEDGLNYFRENFYKTDL